MRESIDKQLLIQPISNLIQFTINSRLKPLLLDQLTELVCECNKSHSVLAKVVLPLCYKLLDETKIEVKTKNEKLIRTLYQVLGQQVVDVCPQNKLQRVCDILMSESGGMGILTFGPSQASTLIKK
mmetsp:Transcript_7255/g.6379  ORF Transcript_7255/g.6379 Transcript_7255/m.6379 type:complete len:126 (+) Transcript_7255:821-1198(+)